MLHSIIDFKSYFQELGWQHSYVIYITILIWSGIIGILAWILDWMTKRILLSLLGKVVSKSTSIWDDMLFEKKFFHRLSHFVPLIVVYSLSPYVLAELDEKATHFVQGSVNIAAIALFLRMLNSFLNGVKEIYNTYEASKYRSINGYLSVVRIIFFSLGVIWIISILIGKSPMYLFTGLSAVAAILMLVFKDTLLGFVASIQLSANDMIRPGDWISFPKHAADGTVTEINLTTVKVQNWDKTITTIPTYSLVADSFQNFRGMEESGGRRIKRSIFIDMNSVKFCDADLLNRFRKIELLHNYVDERLLEIANESATEEGLYHRSRKLTNIGTFRKYLENYLKANPNVNTEMTIIVRQLQPKENGMPIELYLFSRIKEWADYEKVQSDIFDHILAVVHQFELRIFQDPSGHDFQRWDLPS